MWRGHRDNATPEAWSDMRAGVEAALVVAEQHGVTLAFEPEHNNVVDDAAAGRRLLSELDSPTLKAIIDPANLFPGGGLAHQSDTLREAFELLGDELVLAHAKDVGADGTIAAAGRGDLDYDLYVALLRELDRDVPLILHGLAEAEVASSRRFVQAALARGISTEPRGASSRNPPPTRGVPVQRAAIRTKGWTSTGRSVARASPGR
jgi:sugar phosphate isomerase/epimerase